MPRKPLVRQPSESQIELAICHALQLKGICFWKPSAGGFFDRKKNIFRKPSNPWQISGVSDILVIIDGRLLCLEVKKIKGRQTPNQIEFQKKIIEAGAYYDIVYSVENALESIERFKQT